MEGEIQKKQDAQEIMPVFAVSMADAGLRFKELQQFVQSQMVKDEDYGLIPNCKKPSLYKSGAEKLCNIFGFAPRFEMMSETKDFTAGFFHYQVRCKLISKRTGFVVSEGLGACNSKEGRYRNHDAFSLDNTILKMAKKRAMVDATLTATRASGIFTQDVEDIGASDDETHSAPIPRPVTNQAPSKGVISVAQAKRLYAKSKSAGASDEDMKAFLQDEYRLASSKDIPWQKYDEICQRVDAGDANGYSEREPAKTVDVQPEPDADVQV